MANPSLARSSEEAAYDQLQCYTLAHGGEAFIHQHLVDGWAAQRADADTRPIALTFALIGLYLHVVRGYSGRRVQRVHMALARHKTTWPSFPLPTDRGAVTVTDVMAAPAGRGRDQAIDAWCVSVWNAYRDSHGKVAELLTQYGIG